MKISRLSVLRNIETPEDTKPTERTQFLKAC